MLQWHCNTAALPKCGRDVMCPIERTINVLCTYRNMGFVIAQAIASSTGIYDSPIFSFSELLTVLKLTLHQLVRVQRRQMYRLQVHGDFIKVQTAYKSWLVNIIQTPHHFRKYSTIPAKSLNNNILFYVIILC